VEAHSDTHKLEIQEILNYPGKKEKQTIFGLSIKDSLIVVDLSGSILTCKVVVFSY